MSVNETSTTAAIFLGCVLVALLVGTVLAVQRGDMAWPPGSGERVEPVLEDGHELAAITAQRREGAARVEAADVEYEERGRFAVFEGVVGAVGGGLPVDEAIEERQRAGAGLRCR